MAFAARIGLPLALTREVLLKSTATSGILNTRGKNMIDGLLKPNSTIDIWLKDLGIVVDEADTLGVPVYFSSYVLQINILGSSYGWGLQDDSRWVRCASSIPGRANSSCPQSDPSLEACWHRSGPAWNINLGVALLVDEVVSHD
jgi:hypothetical protein